MQYVGVCPPGQPLTFYQKGVNPCCYAQCSDGSIPQAVPVTMGLSDLAWSDVSALIAALMLAACLAAGWSILYKLFYRG